MLGDLTGYTPATLTDRAALDRQLAEVRERGWAVATDELDVGLTAVAAPVRDARGDIVASVSVSGPTFRFGRARVEEVAALVCGAAAEVSGRLSPGPAGR